METVYHYWQCLTVMLAFGAGIYLMVLFGRFINPQNNNNNDKIKFKRNG